MIGFIDRLFVILIELFPNIVHRGVCDDGMFLNFYELQIKNRCLASHCRVFIDCISQTIHSHSILCSYLESS